MVQGGSPARKNRTHPSPPSFFPEYESNEQKNGMDKRLQMYTAHRNIWEISYINTYINSCLHGKWTSSIMDACLQASENNKNGTNKVQTAPSGQPGKKIQEIRHIPMAAPASVGHLHTSIVVFGQRSSIKQDFSRREENRYTYIYM